MPNGVLQNEGDVQEDGDRLMKVRGSYPLPRPDGGLESVEDPLKQFLVEHAEELRLPAAAELTEVHSTTTPLGRVVRYQQQLDGLPVLDTEILVATNADQDRVVQIDLERETALVLPEGPAGGEPITAEQARLAALEATGQPTCGRPAPAHRGLPARARRPAAGLRGPAAHPQPGARLADPGRRGDR